jgi:hypothetical protein
MLFKVGAINLVTKVGIKRKIMVIVGVVVNIAKPVETRYWRKATTTTTACGLDGGNRKVLVVTHDDPSALGCHVTIHGEVVAVVNVKIL